MDDLFGEVGEDDDPSDDTEDLFGGDTDDGDNDLLEDGDAEEEGEEESDIDDLFNHLLPDPKEQHFVQGKEYIDTDIDAQDVTGHENLNVVKNIVKVAVIQTRVDQFGNTAEPVADGELDLVQTEAESRMPIRQWVDNTGLYRVRAQLVEINEDSVRLLKENGRYSKVAWRRLSLEDQSYVLGVASKWKNDEALAAR